MLKQAHSSFGSRLALSLALLTGMLGVHPQINIALAQDLPGATWYVATTGSDANSCASANSPCGTINWALEKAAAGDIVKVATGTYTGSGHQVVYISKDITLSGGWNSSFARVNAGPVKIVSDHTLKMTNIVLYMHPYSPSC